MARSGERVDRDEARKSLGFAPDRKNNSVLRQAPAMEAADGPSPRIRISRDSNANSFSQAMARSAPNWKTKPPPATSPKKSNSSVSSINRSSPGLYKSADLMVIPSRYEPFGLVVNEAMLCGCPVIASDRVGAVRDHHPRRNRFRLPVRSDTTHSHRCCKLVLSDPTRLASIRQNALRRISTWTPQASADALVEAVERAVSRFRNSPPSRKSLRKNSREVVDVLPRFPSQRRRSRNNRGHLGRGVWRNRRRKLERSSDSSNGRHRNARSEGSRLIISVPHHPPPQPLEALRACL